MAQEIEFTREAVLFNEDKWSAEEFVKRFRFHRQDIQRLLVALDISESIVCPNRATVSGRMALLMSLNRLARPRTLYDLDDRFGESQTTCCLASNIVFGTIVENHGHLLTEYLRYLNDAKLNSFEEAIDRPGGTFRVIGFIDGSKSNIFRPTGEVQRQFYSAYYGCHVVRFHFLATPDGMIANLSGLHGGVHDVTLLRHSVLNELLQVISDRDGKLYMHIPMWALRVSVENLFGIVYSRFRHLELASANRILAGYSFEIRLKAAVLLSNAATCLHGN